MVRIGGGVFPDIKEKDYLGEGGYRVDDKAGKVRRLSETCSREPCILQRAVAGDCHGLPASWLLQDLAGAIVDTGFLCFGMAVLCIVEWKLLQQISEGCQDMAAVLHTLW